MDTCVNGKESCLKNGPTDGIAAGVRARFFVECAAVARVHRVPLILQ